MRATSILLLLALPLAAAPLTITICHRIGTSDEREMQVHPLAAFGHLMHGDSLGPCAQCPPNCEV